MLSINLLPPAYKAEIEFAKDNRQKVVWLVNACLMLLLGTIILFSSLYFLNQRTGRINDETAALQPETARLQKIESDAKSLSLRLDNLKNILANHVYWTMVYDQIKEARSQGVIITELLLDSDPKKSQGINGFAPSLESVADFRSALEKKSLVKSVGVRSVSRTQEAGRNGYTFLFNVTLEKNALSASGGTK